MKKIKIFKIIILLILLLFFTFQTIKKDNLYLSFPFMKISSFFNSLIIKIKNYKNKNEIYKKYEIIEKQYYDLLNSIAAFNYIENSIDLIKKYSTDIKNYEKSYIFANINSYKNNLNKNIIIINKGSSDGIKENMPVFYKLSIIGKISNVYKNYSEITTLIDYNSKISVKFDKTDIKGIAQGFENSKLQAFYVQDPDEKIKEGLPVYSSGDGLIFPSGFLVGYIDEIIRNGGLYVTVIIKSIVDYKNLEYCLILNNELDNDKNNEINTLININKIIENKEEIINFKKNTNILSNENFKKNEKENNLIEEKKNDEKINDTKKEKIEKFLEKNKIENKKDLPENKKDLLENKIIENMIPEEIPHPLDKCIEEPALINSDESYYKDKTEKEIEIPIEVVVENNLEYINLD